jgi:poly(3-hydroxybutyrate) depolymerase
VNYDLLIYHDLNDPTESTGSSLPSLGDAAEKWFGPFGEDRHVVALAPPIHRGKNATVVLAHGSRPMPEVQERLTPAPDPLDTSTV